MLIGSGQIRRVVKPNSADAYAHYTPVLLSFSDHMLKFSDVITFCYRRSSGLL